MRTKLAVRDIRNPVVLARANAIKAKFDDLDDLLDTMKITIYTAAGAIAPSDSFAKVDSAVANQAMTLANGTTSGQVINILFRNKTGAGTVKITPATMAGGTYITLASAGQRCAMVWTTVWTVQAGYGGVIT